MDASTAQLTFASIMVVAVIVWLFSLRKALHLQPHQERQEPDPFAPFTAEPTESAVADAQIVSGERTVFGSADDVSRTLAQSLVKTGYPGLFSSLFTIERQSDQQLVIRKTGPLVCNQPTGMYFSEAQFDFVPQGEGRTLVTYRIGFDRLRTKLRRTALILILGLGLPVMIAVGTVIWLLVVPHPNPFVRWQVLQTLQVIHVLWPPFLVMYFYSAGRRHARTWVSNLLGTLDVNLQEQTSRK